MVPALEGFKSVGFWDGHNWY